MRRRIPIDLDRVREMCAAGATQSDIANEFRCSVSTVRNYLRDHGLVAGMGDCSARRDPTPEEIAERAAAIRRRNEEAYRREDWETTRLRLWRDGILQET